MDTLEVTMQTNPDMFICKINGVVATPFILVADLCDALNVSPIGGHRECNVIGGECDRAIPYFFGLASRRNNRKAAKEITDAIITLWSQQINPTVETTTSVATVDANNLLHFIPQELPPLETPRIQLGNTVYTLIPTNIETLEDAGIRERTVQLNGIRTTAQAYVEQNRAETGRRISQLEEQIRNRTPMVNASLRDVLATGVRICKDNEHYIVFFPSVLKTERVMTRRDNREYALKEEFCRSDELLLGIGVDYTGSYLSAFMAGMNGEVIAHPHSYEDYRLCIHPSNFPTRVKAITDNGFIQYAKAIVDSLLVILRTINCGSIARSRNCDRSWQTIVNAGYLDNNIEPVAITTETLGWGTTHEG